MVDFIIEIANTHGGDKQYLLELIKEFESFEGHGMKFQPLHPDEISTPDFEWHNVYKELMFSSYEWTEILELAGQTKKVWLDLFDRYGITILKENLNKVYGIKLQASVLYNEQVIQALRQIDCSQLRLIVNVSALSIDAISERLSILNASICPSEIFIEVGFQAYPTDLIDSGLNKITEIKRHFPNRIVFADHADGKSKDAITLPFAAALLGADLLEKHVMHSRRGTKYDYFSSITVQEYTTLVQQVIDYKELLNQPFFNKKELQYLQNSIQKPLARKVIHKGKSIDFTNELDFKRSNQIGLDAVQLKNLMRSGYVLAHDISAGRTFMREDFRRAVIGVVIACRLKSSRLKRKAVLKIGKVTSVERCIQSCLQFPATSYTVLATSTLEEDAELAKYTFAPQVIFHQGDPDDVIHRYIETADRIGIDVVIRVTADMPYVSSEITDILLNAHFESGADYTAARHCAVGTAPEIINVSALKKVKAHFKAANYSEYMTWYFQNNGEHFKVNNVDLPPELIRDYRLTLDYQEDLDLFNEIENYLLMNKKKGSLYEIFTFLDEHQAIAQINRHLTLKYKTDQNLIDMLNKVTKIN